MTRGDTGLIQQALHRSLVCPLFQRGTQQLLVFCGFFKVVPTHVKGAARGETARKPATVVACPVLTAKDLLYSKSSLELRAIYVCVRRHVCINQLRDYTWYSGSFTLKFRTMRVGYPPSVGNGGCSSCMAVCSLHPVIFYSAPHSHPDTKHCNSSEYTTACCLSMQPGFNAAK